MLFQHQIIISSRGYSNLVVKYRLIQMIIIILLLLLLLILIMVIKIAYIFSHKQINPRCVDGDSNLLIGLKRLGVGKRKPCD